MLVERYLSNKEYIGIDDNGFLIGDISRQVDSVTGIADYAYSLEDYSQISDIIKNPFTIIVGNGGLGKSVLLDQMSFYIEKEKHPYLRIDLRSLVKEEDLFTNINNFLISKTKTDEEIYILLDAIDEAIDHGIRNPIGLIAQDVRRTLEIHSKCKFIITTRSQVNNIKSLSDNLLKIYDIEKKSVNYIYQLCPFTIDDIKSVAKTKRIIDVEEFLKNVQKFSLGSFLATPITCKTVIKLYKDNRINDNTNHYDIYLELTADLCKESSEYRCSQAADGIGKFNTLSIDELLFVAGKMATELKINNKAFLSIDEKDKEQCVFVEDFYNLTIKTKFHKHFEFTKENINAVLNSKLFYKTGNKYEFCQKTYSDFLCAYYFLNIDIDIKKFGDLFVFENKVHPSYYEIASLLALHDKKFLDYFLKKNPEALIFSSIVFNDVRVKKQLLEKLIKLAKQDEHNYRRLNIYTIYKKLNFPEAKQTILNAFESSNEDVLTLITEYVNTNKLNGFDKQLKRIIFGNQYSSRLKMFAVIAIKENPEYNNAVECLYKKFDIIKAFFEKDEKNNLRAVVLEALYPKYINDEALLSYIVPIKDTVYHGWYNDYIRKEFLNSKYINKDNVLLFTRWVLNNEIYGITREEYYGSHSKYHLPDNIKKFFVRVADFFEDKRLIDEIINFQVKTYRHTCKCFSEFLFNKIVSNARLRIYALKRYIEIAENNFDLHFLDKYLFVSDDLGYLIALYHNETDISVKEKYKYVINGGYWDYLYNDNTKDIQYIFNVFRAHPELKREFNRFGLTKCFINPITGEPVGKYARDAKNCYLEDLKRKEKQQKQEEVRLKRQQFYNDEPARIKELLDKYADTKNANLIEKIFCYLMHEADSTNLCFSRFLDFTATYNWHKLDKIVQGKVVSVCLDYLKANQIFAASEDSEIYLEKISQKRIWNCLSALEFLKQKSFDEYCVLLQKHKFAILYFKPLFDRDKFKQKQMLQDLYKIEEDFIEEQVNKFALTEFNEATHYIDLFDKLSLLDEELFTWLENIYKLYGKKLSKYSLVSIISYLVSQNNTFGINVCIEQINKNISNASFLDDEVLMSFLKNLLEHFQPEYWGIIKKVFYRNKNGVDIFKRVASYFDYHQGSCINYSQMSNDDMTKFYIWIGRHMPKIKYKAGCHNYRYEEHIENGIYNFWINTGNYKCIKAVKKTMCSKKAYRSSYNVTFNQYLLNQQIDIQKFRKIENSADKKSFSLFNVDKSISTGNIVNSIVGHIGHKN